MNRTERQNEARTNRALSGRIAALAFGAAITLGATEAAAQAFDKSNNQYVSDVSHSINLEHTLPTMDYSPIGNNQLVVNVETTTHQPKPEKTPVTENFNWINLLPENNLPKDEVPMNPKSLENYEHVINNQLEEGQEYTSDYDYMRLTLNKMGTIINVRPDKELNGVWVLVDVPGGNIQEITDEHGNEQYYGATVNYFLQNDVEVKNTETNEAETGLESLAPHLKQGDIITFAYQAQNLNDPLNEEFNTRAMGTFEFNQGLSDTREDNIWIKATTAYIYPNQ